MKNQHNRHIKPRTFITSLLGRVAAISLFGIFLWGAAPNHALAAVETSFLYRLSNFSGPIPYSWFNLSVDEARGEIYVADPKERDIRVFNREGMEIYRFGDDGRLGTVMDVAVKEDGSILVLSRMIGKTSIIFCNFRGDPIKAFTLHNLPPDFSGFSPSRLALKKGRIYLADRISLRIAVTDEEGLYLKGYDIGLLLGIEEKKRGESDMEGFSVDREGNMLFTIPVFFTAYSLSPGGKLRGFGRPGGAPGKFSLIGGIVADEKGNHYVADSAKSVILVFDKDFQFLKEFGYRGIGPDNLIGPRNIALDARGRLYVSQLKRRGVSVFKITHDSQ